MLNDINTSSYHTPIMLPQVLSLLRPERGGTYVDGTLGGGGHSLGILRSLPAGGRLFGSVTSKEVAEELVKQHHIKIDKKKFVLPDGGIKTLGTTVVDVKIYKGIVGELKVEVTEA